MAVSRVLVLCLGLVCAEKVKGECPSPPIIRNAYHNGSFFTETYEEGDVISYSCINGFERRGSPYFRCGEGVWNGGNFTCEALHCPAPGTDHLELSFPRTVGSLVTARCSQGYRLVGPSRLACTVHLHWRPDPPTCELVTCPLLPRLAFGERSQNTFSHEPDTYGSVVESQCQPGFRLRGSSVQVCQDDGAWSGETAFCEEVTCSIPEVGHGILESPELMRLDDVNTVYCFSNATFNGEAGSSHGEILCTEEGWTEGYCYGNCDVGDIEGLTTEQQVLNHGETLHWGCDGEYVRPPGLDDVICDDGRLTAEPECHHITRDPGNHCQATSSGDIGLRYGNTCYFFLQDAYDSKWEALDVCMSRYTAGLVTVRHQETRYFLQSALASTGWTDRNVWLGLKWDSGWKWDNDDELNSFSSSQWQSGEGGEFFGSKFQECAIMEGDENLLWDDVRCATLPFVSNRYAICERVADF